VVDVRVDAVVRGDLSHDRLEEAAGRVQEFAGWSAGLTQADTVDTISNDIGFAAARRAIRLAGAVQDALPLSAAPHVVEFVATTNLAIGKETPWGVAAPLLELIDAHTFDLYDEPMTTAGELELYGIQTQSPLFAMAAGILAEGAPLPEAFTLDASVAMVANNNLEFRFFFMMWFR